MWMELAYRRASKIIQVKADKQLAVYHQGSSTISFLLTLAAASTPTTGISGCAQPPQKTKQKMVKSYQQDKSPSWKS